MKTINIKELWWVETNQKDHYPRNCTIEICGCRVKESDKPVKICIDYKDFMSCVNIVKMKVEIWQKEADEKTKLFNQAIKGII